MNRVNAHARCLEDAPRAGYLLRWLAAKDLVESLRHEAEDALGRMEAHDVILALEECESLLKDSQPRLLG